MKYKTLLLLVPVLMSASFAVADEKQNAQSAAILAQYPQTEAFKQFSQPLRAANPPQTLFQSVCFLNGSSDAGLLCAVRAKGQVSTVRKVYNWAYQGSRRSQLTPKQLAELRKVLQKMPSNAAKPTLNNLLIVNFIEANKPATRIYDRSKLPTQIVKLYQLIGASEIGGSPIQTPKK